MTKGLGGEAFALKGGRISNITLVSITVATSILSLALPVTTLQVYDRILPNHSTGTLLVLILGVAAIICLEVLLRLARAYLIGFSGAAHTHGLSCAAVRHVLSADISAGSAASNRTDFHDLGAIRNLKEFSNGHSLTTMVELIFVPVFLGLIAYIAGWLVMVPVALLLAFTLFSLANGASLKAALATREARDDRRYSFLIGSLNAVHAIKAFAQEQKLMRRYERLQQQSCIANFDVSGAMTTSFNASALFSNLMTAAAVGFGALAVIEGRLTVGALIAVVLLSGRIMQPVQKGVMLWARYQDYKISRKKVQRLFYTPVMAGDLSQHIPSNDGSLDIEELSFRYAEDQPLLLDGLTLSLRKGEVISITGAQGCGKSTVLKLIAGLHRPSGGQVLINGLESTRFAPHRLNEQVGYMSTEGTVFRGTIRDNITRFGDVPTSQAMFVASLLGLDQEIAKLPAGLDTKLEGTGSDSIPPGIKQRISLARVLATKPRILLFDNADVALDLEGYGMIHSLLGRLKPKVSMIIVSEDENLRRLADQHYELESGRLFEISSGLGKDILPTRQYRNVRL